MYSISPPFNFFALKSVTGKLHVKDKAIISHAMGLWTYSLISPSSASLQASPQLPTPTRSPWRACLQGSLPTPIGSPWRACSQDSLPTPTGSPWRACSLGSLPTPTGSPWRACSQGSLLTPTRSPWRACSLGSLPPPPGTPGEHAHRIVFPPPLGAPGELAHRVVFQPLPGAPGELAHRVVWRLCSITFFSMVQSGSSTNCFTTLTAYFYLTVQFRLARFNIVVIGVTAIHLHSFLAFLRYKELLLAV